MTFPRLDERSDDHWGSDSGHSGRPILTVIVGSRMKMTHVSHGHGPPLRHSSSQGMSVDKVSKYSRNHIQAVYMPVWSRCLMWLLSGQMKMAAAILANLNKAVSRQTTVETSSRR